MNVECVHIGWGWFSGLIALTENPCLPGMQQPRDRPPRGGFIPGSGAEGTWARAVLLVRGAVVWE